MTGKTERQSTSRLKRILSPNLLIQPYSYRLGDLLPADDPLDKYRDGDKEDGEADRQLVKEGMIPLPVDTARYCSYRLGVLLPTDDSPDEIRDGDSQVIKEGMIPLPADTAR